MATIRIEKQHALGLEESKVRARKLLDKFSEKLSHLISESGWNPDGTEGFAKGKMFDARFSVKERAVDVSIELKGLMANALKGQVETQMKTSLDRSFDS
jgi:hypothetical protein